MRFHILTLFPEMILSGMGTSIIGRAQRDGLLSVEARNIRDYTTEKHGHVDDYPYGGGAGMLMQADPILRCYRALSEELQCSPRVIYTTPQGKLFDQGAAKELAREEELVILCGHYEGVDERALALLHADCYSIGDYVLTGGELPAMVVMDSVLRLLKGNLKEGSAEEESFENGLLEYPQYTQPSDFQGDRVPAVLLSGHHENIQRWRKKESLRITLERRPDLLRARELSEEEQALLGELRRERERR